MENQERKLQIVDSLRDLDAAQTQRVLDYIKQLSTRPAGRLTFSKREAMLQINHALRSQKSQYGL